MQLAADVAKKIRAPLDARPANGCHPCLGPLTRTANAERRRFYARCDGKRPQQIVLRSDDADLAVCDLDPLSQRTEMVAAVAAAGDPQPLAGG